GEIGPTLDAVVGRRKTTARDSPAPATTRGCPEKVGSAVPGHFGRTRRVVDTGTSVLPSGGTHTEARTLPLRDLRLAERSLIPRPSKQLVCFEGGPPSELVDRLNVGLT